jgi:hypothetical protein
MPNRSMSPTTALTLEPSSAPMATTDAPSLK